jgi:hypothetical protein
MSNIPNNITNYPPVSNSSIGGTLTIINQDIALKSLIFGMIFYVVASPIFVQYLDRFLPVGFDTIVIQSILFSILYYFIESAI